MLTLSIVMETFIAGALIAYIVSLTSKNKRLLEESERLRQDTESKQQIIINRVKEKESRISAQELAERYIPIRAHDLVVSELAETRLKLSGKEQQMLELTKSLTALKKDEEI